MTNKMVSNRETIKKIGQEYHKFRLELLGLKKEQRDLLLEYRELLYKIKAEKLKKSK